jgi:flagellar motility protein MotE (MotC chaperone)
MVADKADFGILVAACRQGQPLWKPYPPKNVLVCDADNFIFASQMARLLVMAKQRVNKEEIPQRRIKRWEEWIKDKLPNYLLRLEKYFTEWEKDIGRINTSVKNMEKTREEIKKLVLEEMEGELKNI